MKTVTENDHIINCIARATRLAINGNAPIDDAKNTNSVPCQKNSAMAATNSKAKMALFTPPAQSRSAPPQLLPCPAVQPWQ